MKTSNTLIPLVIVVFILSSCVNRNNPKKEQVKEALIAELNAEAIQTLEEIPSIVVSLYNIKRQKVDYIESLPDLKRFNLNGDRKSLSLQFGMLTTAIAYEKIIGNKTQIPELLSIYQDYARKLNVDPMVISYFNAFLDSLSGKVIDSVLVVRYKEEWRKNQREIVQKLKELDEAFLVYYTLGVFTEVSYYKTLLIDPKKHDPSETMGTRPSKTPTFIFITQLYDTRYGDYARTLKPMVDILMNADYTKTFTSDQKRKIIDESVKKAREQAFE